MTSVPTSTDDTTTYGVNVSSTSMGPGTSSITSSMSGLDTPDAINLRKGIGTETPESINPKKQLYKVLEKQDASGAAKAGLFGTSHTYKMQGKKRQDVPGGVHVAILPDDIGNLDEKTLKRKYDEQQRMEEDEPSRKK